MRPITRLALSMTVSLLSGTPSSAAGKITGVVELFTSQGCSSCPPADAVLEQLAKQPGVAVLSLPVDYWDRLGWKDTYGSPAHSARQRAYALARGDGAVYTPQAVVNGAQHMNGADRGEIEANLDQLKSSLSVAIDLSQSKTALRVAVAAAPTGGEASPATLILLPYLAHREVAIGRGENAKRRVAYTNIVRNIGVLGQWSGEARTFELPLARLAPGDGVIALLQTGTAEAPGPIIGAAQLTFEQ